MKLDRYIANLGYGSRREVNHFLDRGQITARDGRTLSANELVDHDDILIDGESLDPAPGVLIMLNKPVGYVCSTTDENPLVYDLLPPRFRRRSPIVAPIGRLDRDTSGLLFLTDDGQLNHRITSPRAHLPKVYEATLAADLRGDEAELFAGGTLALDGETTPLAPATLEICDGRRVRVTLAEGRYHQVRRMFAAVGNHVDTLHRASIGAVTLGGLGLGDWRVLTADELERVRRELATRRSSSPTAP